MPGLPFHKGRRVRVFGGPNGSGKTTIINLIKSSFDVGYYINADEIENQLRNEGIIQLEDYGLKNIDPRIMESYFDQHPLQNKANQLGYYFNLQYDKGLIHTSVSDKLSYESAVIASFLRDQLIAQGKKMTFETVMSHPSKVVLLDKANQNGYKTYLYFICTSSPKINLDRVNLRVQQGGHDVQEELIIKRYYKSLELLKSAVSKTYRSFIWDNSGKEPKLILEVFNGRDVRVKNSQIPHWLDKYLLSK